LFGAMVTFNPNKTLNQLIVFLGVVILLGGVILVFISLRNRKESKAWKGLMTFAIVDVLLGLFLMIFTTLAVELLMILIGIWALLVGIYEFIHYFQLAKEIRHRSVSPYIGVVAIILGLIMLLVPHGTSIFMTILAGILSMALGVLLVGISFSGKKESA
jgi:uncharacterized membrane protein HdeD (DUF308 family)